MYADSFESQEAWLYCVIFSAYTTLLNKLLHNKLSKSAKHLNSTVTHCIFKVGMYDLSPGKARKTWSEQK
jgi:hypothetical protein